MFVHLSFFITFSPRLWLNYGVVWCVTLILRFLLQFVTLLQVPAIITWLFFVRGGCVYLCLLRDGIVSTLDLFPLMSQGWLWSSWSFFITVSLLSVQHLNTLTSLDCAFFFFLNSAWVHLLGTAGLNQNSWWCDNSKLFNLTSWKLHHTRCRFCTIAVCSLMYEGGSRWGLDWLGLTDKCAVMIPESPSVFFCSPCCKNRKWE